MKVIEPLLFVVPACWCLTGGCSPSSLPQSRTHTMDGHEVVEVRSRSGAVIDRRKAASEPSGGADARALADRVRAVRASHLRDRRASGGGILLGTHQPDAVDHSAETLATLSEVIRSEPLGVQIRERFGADPSAWRGPLLNSYLDYLAADGGAEGASTESRLDKALRESGEVSTVTVETGKPGARVCYVPVLFASSQSADQFEARTSPSTQPDVVIGRYRIWTERNSDPTSSKKDAFWIIRQDVKIPIEEAP